METKSFMKISYKKLKTRNLIKLYKVQYNKLVKIESQNIILRERMGFIPIKKYRSLSLIKPEYMTDPKYNKKLFRRLFIDTIYQINTAINSNSAENLRLIEELKIKYTRSTLKKSSCILI